MLAIAIPPGWTYLCSTPLRRTITFELPENGARFGLQKRKLALVHRVGAAERARGCWKHVEACLSRLRRALSRRRAHQCPHANPRCQAGAICDDCARDGLEAMW